MSHEACIFSSVLTLVIMAGIIAKLPIIIILMDILPPIAVRVCRQNLVSGLISVNRASAHAC
jgi:Sec-independent protein secretion pathway component TatC